MKNLTSLALKLEFQRIFLLDQQALPHAELWVDATEPEQMIAAIKALKVRGAPLIGVAAALCLACFSLTNDDPAVLRSVALKLRQSRPTAVNLMWAIDRLLPFCNQPERLQAEAEAIFEEDVLLCEQMGAAGAALIEDGDRILTHCNSGGLATAGIGTALGVIHSAWKAGKKIHVYVDETRPLLQGARLTAWELSKLGIPYTLISDNMAAMLMRQKAITKIFVGADRIACNGDFANKIGTYGVAVSAHYHQLPFYTVAPYSTIDLECPDWESIPIEQRGPEEVRGVVQDTGTIIWAPHDAPTYNPAFDITPVDLLTALITDRGVYSREELLAGALKNI
jgi:methylthioribose-1-phosphate isomerase